MALVVFAYHKALPPPPKKKKKDGDSIQPFAAVAREVLPRPPAIAMSSYSSGDRKPRSSPDERRFFFAFTNICVFFKVFCCFLFILFRETAGSFFFGEKACFVQGVFGRTPVLTFVFWRKNTWPTSSPKATKERAHRRNPDPVQRKPPAPNPVVED